MTNSAALPEELEKLPSPWNITGYAQRSAAVQVLAKDAEQITIALDGLENCFQASVGFPSSGVELPAEVASLWAVIDMWLAELMPSLQEFSATRVEQLLKQKFGAGLPAEAIALQWLQATVNAIIRSILYWLKDAMMPGKNGPRQNRLLALAEHYWRSLDDEGKMLLIDVVTFITWRAALPMLAAIEQDPHISEQVRDSTQRYRLWVIHTR